jgi:putative ATPase
VLIGATTENPSFEVVSPLLSRATVYDLKPLTPGEIRQIIGMALRDSASGLGNLDLKLDDSGIESIVKLSNGDARNALNTLELSAHAALPDASGTRLVDAEVVESAAQRKIARYDKDGDLHFDTISAFIKSVRSSDPDAAIYWLARMIEGGEDPMFIARRLVILASEDIGMADPNALTVAVSAQQAAHFVGMPEGRIVLAEATVYLASAPKSNTAYSAISAALEDARNTRNDPVPLHLRNAVTGLMKDMGYGEDYKYAHDYDGNFTPMQNLPDNLSGRQYYKPGDQGYEVEVSKRLANWWGTEDSDDQDAG